MLYGEEEVKNFELENKKVLETPSNINTTINTTGKLEKLIEGNEKKKKSKKPKIETPGNVSSIQTCIKPIGNSKSIKYKGVNKPEKKEENTNISAKMVPATSTVAINNFNYLNRNIFAVSGGHGKINPSINALRCDS